jgi:hypothetical protein
MSSTKKEITVENSAKKEQLENSLIRKISTENPEKSKSNEKMK